MDEPVWLQTSASCQRKTIFTCCFLSASPKTTESVQVRLRAGEEDFLPPIFVVDVLFFLPQLTKPDQAVCQSRKESFHTIMSSAAVTRISKCDKLRCQGYRGRGTHLYKYRTSLIQKIPAFQSSKFFNITFNFFYRQKNVYNKMKNQVCKHSPSKQRSGRPSRTSSTWNRDSSINSHIPAARCQSNCKVTQAISNLVFTILEYN